MGSGNLIDDDQSVRFEQPLKIRQRLADAAGCVQDIAADDQIDLVREESLRFCPQLQIKGSELCEWVKFTEALPAILEKCD